MRAPIRHILLLIIVISSSIQVFSQHSIAREMNEIVLTGIRNDFARPTVHARNLYHTSIAMYDIWAIYNEPSEPYLIGNTVDGFSSTLEEFPLPTDITSATNEAIAFAVYRIMVQRYRFSPDWDATLDSLNTLMIEKSYDVTIESTNYLDGNPAHLGNFVAQTIIDFGLQDGANESDFYRNQYYNEVNAPLIMKRRGNPDISDPNRWQPLSVDIFIDQSGNEVPSGALKFLSPEWGNVVPFSLTEMDKTTYTRDGDDYQVYLDPGPPWLIDTLNGEGDTEKYQWAFSMVSVWSAQLSPDDGVMWDISPGAKGNVDFNDYPTTFEEYKTFYDFENGGDIGTGHAMNPKTGQPYTPNIVPRGDYTRVLAEFWADGPDSETPPGHWFSILNYVNDHPEFERKYRGEGEVMDPLEWDVKAYLILGGAMHDSAIAAWGVKGWYDYLRPVSALRYMCGKGQSSDPNLPNYHVAGIPLIDGYIEQIISDDDPLWEDSTSYGKIKLFAWRGPDFIANPADSEAGVGWILGEEWWPYQRPSFVSPPFAGYVSGHSTYSRAAAEALTLITGDPFFPGGIGEFVAPMNEFLVFEDGPSQDITFQWATYSDASDQTSLSRIWGGIHPAIDDIPGRRMGEVIGKRAVTLAENYFNISTNVDVIPEGQGDFRIIENPVQSGNKIRLISESATYVRELQLVNIQGQLLKSNRQNQSNTQFAIATDDLPAGLYILNIIGEGWQTPLKISLQ